MTQKDTVIFIEHILESIRDIESFSLDVSKEELSKNREKLNAIVRSIEIIGEAAKNIPSSLKKEYPKVAWKEIVGARDVLIHHYFGIDLDILWEIIKKDIPLLKKQILEIKEKLTGKSQT